MRQRPHHQADPHRQQQGRGQRLQPLDGFRAANHHEQVERPEHEEADDLAHPAQRLPVGREARQQQVDGQPAEHRLDTEPATGDHRANHAWHVGADDAEGGAQHHREGYPEARAGEGVEGQRNQHHQVGDQNREQRLADAQAEVGGQDATQGVGRHADRHADPQCGDVPARPGAFGTLGRRDILVVTRAAGDILCHHQLDHFLIAAHHVRARLCRGHESSPVQLLLLLRVMHCACLVSLVVSCLPHLLRRFSDSSSLLPVRHTSSGTLHSALHAEDSDAEDSAADESVAGRVEETPCAVRVQNPVANRMPPAGLLPTNQTCLARQLEMQWRVFSCMTPVRWRQAMFAPTVSMVRFQAGARRSCAMSPQTITSHCCASSFPLKIA